MGLGLPPAALRREPRDRRRRRFSERSETAMTSVNISEEAATAPSAVVPSRETQAVSTTDSSGSASVPSSAGPAILDLRVVVALAPPPPLPQLLMWMPLLPQMRQRCARRRRPDADQRCCLRQHACGNEEAGEMHHCVLHPTRRVVAPWDSALCVASVGTRRRYKRLSRHDSEGCE